VLGISGWVDELVVVVVAIEATTAAASVAGAEYRRWEVEGADYESLWR
jgi:hypothetical protein